MEEIMLLTKTAKKERKKYLRMILTKIGGKTH